MKKINLNKHNVTKGIFLLVFTLLCNMGVSAQRTFTIGDLKYTTTSDSTVSVSKKVSIWRKLVIPASVEYAGTQYSVTSIGDFAFDGCKALPSVTIPNSVTSIGRSAFDGCGGLTSITIPNSVTSIGNFAFDDCNGLTSVTIPNSVTSIGVCAFNGCSSLTSITIGSSVTSIGGGAFSGCNGLTSVTINSNAILSKTSSRSSLKEVFGEQVKEYQIGNNVEKIGSHAFEGCRGLTSVTIGSSVTSIGNYAFYGCSGLTSVTIGSSVTSIENYAFEGCTGLTSVTINSNAILSKTYSSRSSLKNIFGEQVKEYQIGNNVEKIGKEAFNNCSKLTSVTIPNSVTSIEYMAFYGCTGLTKVIVNDIVAWCNISFAGLFSNPLDYAQHLYSDENTEITDLVIPDEVTAISSYAFSDCTGLTSVTIPNSVTSIGQQAFEGCSGLTSITIPNSVTSIGTYAFSDCTGLTDIYCHIEEPLTISSNVFRYVPKNSCTLHVPIGSKEKYKAADVWKDFLNIVEDLPTGIISIDNSQLTNDNDVWYTLSGTRLNGKPTKAGIYIVNGTKVVIK